ncbi:hypothetical protein FRB90_005246, partial [Tulasnella sp. 427]
MDYLVIEGYKSAAEEFSKEAGLNHTVDLGTIETRMNIREAVQRGDVEQAIELVNDIDPTILDSNPSLLFHLQQQRLIEYIRHGKTTEALAFAQTELAPRGENNPEFLTELEHTMALLAFDVDNSGTPEQIVELLTQSQRLKTAGELNAAILEALNQGRETKLLALATVVAPERRQTPTRAEFQPPTYIARMVPGALDDEGVGHQKLALYIKAELQGVTDLQPASDDFEWFFKDSRDLSTGHDTANFVWRCSSCKRESSAKFDQFPDKRTLKPYQVAQNKGQDFAPLIVLDCRGLEFVGFDVR